jgi:predicted nucleic acid-binding Zn ribbon protein
MNQRRDNRTRNWIFLVTVISAVVVGIWLAR